MVKKKSPARPVAAKKPSKAARPTKPAKSARAAMTSRPVTGKKPIAAAKPARPGKKAVKKGVNKPMVKADVPVKGAAKAYLTAIASKNAPANRIAALRSAPLAVCENDRSFQATLAILRDPDEPIDVRLEALQSLQAASFSVVAFEPCRQDYMAALHAIAEDPDPELRKRALGILARNNDATAQKKLLKGLTDPSKALVPPERALSLLANNPHAGAFKVARDIVASPPNPAAKHQALRLLSADAQSVDLLDKILTDKSEAADNRQIAASALHALHPDKLQERARSIVLDPGEDAELKAKCLTALTNFGDQNQVTSDNALIQHVRTLSSAPSPSVSLSANQFLSKYGQ